MISLKCFIILVGSELLNGMMVDTNSVFMAEELNKYGIEIVGKIVVGDKIEEIKDAIGIGKKRADIVVMSGGLGPTIDDLTRDAIAEYLGLKLIVDEDEFGKMKERFFKQNLEMPERNIRQVMFPENAKIIANMKGVAPSFYIEDIAVFPGVPDELKDSFPRFMEFLVANKNLREKMYIKDILIWGLPESELEKRILDIIENEKEVFVEFLVKDFGIIIRFLTEEENIPRVNILKEAIYNRVGEYIFGEDDDRIEKLLITELKNKGYTISTAESCTGGLVASMLSGIPGVSSVFIEGIVTYANESKVDRLGVSNKTLEQYGAVSENTVLEMLKGLKTDTGIAISGVAGPDGGSIEKPVGTVFIGTKIADKYIVERYEFRGDRNKVRHRAAMTALNELRKRLK